MPSPSSPPNPQAYPRSLSQSDVVAITDDTMLKLCSLYSGPGPLPSVLPDIRVMLAQVYINHRFPTPFSSPDPSRRYPMGQYWLTVNIDRREFFNSHNLGSGLKLLEQMGTYPGVLVPLFLLTCAMPEARGGGDPLPFSNVDEEPMIGRWAGDRIVTVGDYAKASDITACNPNWASRNPDADTISPQKLYTMCSSVEGAPPHLCYTDITPSVVEMIEARIGGKFSGDGWTDWTPNEDWLPKSPTPIMTDEIYAAYMKAQAAETPSLKTPQPDPEPESPAITPSASSA